MANQWQSNPMSDAISEIEQTPKYQTKKESDIPPFHVNPKNIKSRIGELSVQVSLKRHLFVTDGTVEGQLTIKCLKENSCKLGKILIHLIGIEELTSKRKPIVRTFLSKTWIVQDQRLAPSDAV
jgi:ribosomal protein S30